MSGGSPCVARHRMHLHRHTPNNPTMRITVKGVWSVEPWKVVRAIVSVLGSEGSTQYIRRRTFFVYGDYVMIFHPVKDISPSSFSFPGAWEAWDQAQP